MNANEAGYSTSDRPDLPAEIGGFQIQRVLGAGGMATVYAALQRQPRRTVAIKVMRGAVDARAALRRFKREIEILGRLRHAYIAQVYDAGMHEDPNAPGRPVPYFVMEYVPRARTILEYAAEKQLDLRDRLKLFVKVCAAVEHGHARKIIHRDLKPGNILIDESGDPKIIDFGVARAVELDLTAQTMHTEAGRLIGTVQYMAPEQLDTTLHDLDARCDVYALGVLLFKLLTGRSPHDVQGLPVFTAAQVIRTDAPPRPGSIRPELKGDLETIILKALEKDPKRRYRTAGSFGRDIVRYLADKPIHARRTSAAHRTRLFARRHKTELRAAAIVVIVIGIAAAIVIYQRLSLDRVPEGAPSVAVDTTTIPPAAPDRVDEAGAETAIAASPEADDTVDAAPPGEVIVPDWFRIEAASDPIVAITFDSSGRFVVTAAGKGGLKVWDLASRQPVLEARDHDAPVKHIALSSDGTLLITAADDGRIVVVDREANRITRLVHHDCAVVHALAFDSATGRIAIACDDFTVRRFEAGGDEAKVLRGSTGAFHSLAFSPDGDSLAAGSDRGAISIWNASTGALEERRDELTDRVVDLAFRSDGDELIAVAADGTALRWSLADSGTEPSRIHLEVDDPTIATIASSGDFLAYEREGSVGVIDVERDRALRRMQPLPDEIDITSIAISSDGRWFAAGGSRGLVLLNPIEAAW